MYKKRIVLKSKAVYLLEQVTGENPIWTVSKKKKDGIVGHIQWIDTMNEFCFYPLSPSALTKDILEGIANFITTLTDYRETGTTYP